MSGGGCMRGVRPPRVDPNAPAAARAPAGASAGAGADLPTHTVPANTEDETAAPAHPPAGCASLVDVLLFIILFGAALGVLFFGFWMDPVASIDAVSAAGLDAAGGDTVSPSFDVAIRLKTRSFHIVRTMYENGTVAVSCAGGAATAAGALPDFVLTAFSPAVVSATVRAPPTALPGDERERLRGELQRGEVHLDVSVAYKRVYVLPWGHHGLRVLCAATLLSQGNSTASCTIVKQ